MKNKKMSGGKKMAMLGSMAALGAGAYYLLGPKAKAHQKKASALMAKMKKEVASEIKKAKMASMPVYHKAVDLVSENYAKEYKAHEKDIKAFARKLKSEWKNVSKKATQKSSKVSRKKK